MSVLKKYLLVNLALIFYHPMLYFAGIMGFGSAPVYTPDSELIKGIFALAFVGACPNLFVFLISAFRRKNIKENLIWFIVFFSFVFSAYVALFWRMIG